MMLRISVNSVLSIVREIIVKKYSKVKISKINKLKWWIITEMSMNENRSGDNESFIFTVWYS